MARERAGKFPIAADEGPALSEFIDSAGVNNPETSPTRAPLREVTREPAAKSTLSWMYIAAGAAIATGLFLFFRRR